MAREPLSGAPVTDGEHRLLSHDLGIVGLNNVAPTYAIHELRQVSGPVQDAGST